MSVQRSSRYRVADDEERDASVSRVADEPSLPSELEAAPGEQAHRAHSPSSLSRDRGGSVGGSVSGLSTAPRVHYQPPHGHTQLRPSQPPSPASVAPLRPTLSRPPSYSLSAAPPLPIFHESSGSARSSFSISVAHHQDAHMEEQGRAHSTTSGGWRNSPAPSPRHRSATPTAAFAAAPVEAKPADSGALHATHVSHRTPHIVSDAATAIQRPAAGSEQTAAAAAAASAAAVSIPASSVAAAVVTSPPSSAVPPSPRSTAVPAPVAVRPSAAAGPPPLQRPHSAAPAAASAASSLSWVCQTNRELVRVLFGKRMTTHRGILEGPFQGMQDQPAVAAASSPKHSRSLSLSKSLSFSSSSSSAVPPALAAQQQLLHAHMLRFHISLVGVANSGKTSTAHNLTGRSVPAKHMETSGMHIVDLAWPYKTADGCVFLCDLLLWDSGFTSSAQYKYIQTTPESHAQLVLYVVSCVDRNSWMLVQRKLEEDASKPFAKLLVLTKIDDRTKREVHEADIVAFQDKYNRAHYPAACSPAHAATATATASGATAGASAATSPPSSSQCSYTLGSLVVCKIANWPISNEPFYTRPGVTSLLNTITAMCIAAQPTR